MGQPVVHFEIIGKDPARLRNYFGELFGWEFDTSSPVAEAVSEPMNYGFVNRITTSDGTGIPGGVGGGAGYDGHVIFYIGVPDVEARAPAAGQSADQRPHAAARPCGAPCRIRVGRPLGNARGQSGGAGARTQGAAPERGHPHGAAVPRARGGLPRSVRPTLRHRGRGGWAPQRERSVVAPLGGRGSGAPAGHDPPQLQRTPQERPRADSAHLGGLGGDRIAVGIDAKDGEVMVRGWEQKGKLRAVELAHVVAKAGVERIIYTDVARDGMLTGINIEQTLVLARESGLKVTASGGVSSLEDIKRLNELSGFGIDSMIIGKALYERRFTLKEALQAVLPAKRTS